MPKKGAVLFAVNHPNGLLDPLLVATNTPRVSHFLVQAGVFKTPLIQKILASLNLMPIYRIRDGRNEISKNTAIFERCFEILNNQQALMIFPEGSHDKRRTVRPISKGFTRIVFGALEKYSNLQIQIVPVGITYQHSGDFPSKAALCFGTPILANNYYQPDQLKESIADLKRVVSEQLKTLTVHIPADENYENTLQRLNEKKIDFTLVNNVNKAITTNKIPLKKGKKNAFNPLRIVWICNSFLAWRLWKLVEKKIKEDEFIDTFRFVIGLTVFPIYYALEIFTVNYFFGSLSALCYTIFTISTAVLYVKSATTLPKAHPQ